MAKVLVMEHPLIQHKIGIIRRKSTSSKEFRELVSEVAMFMAYEATRELKLADVEIETPITKTTVKELAGKKMAVADSPRRSWHGRRYADHGTGCKGGAYRTLPRPGNLKAGGILLQASG